ncbi:response regulator transcription factor [Nocardioides sp. SR21]|uniref:response regulator transcription factor n=1 Tax=Nocardioides sp. SR21 TaxID=2919501 RepID=UPI001FAB1B93|nr:response regulator transcription factor [Nocardioides sp. SR21]
MSEQAELRVLVVDDHPMFREGLIAVVDSLPWAAVVGEAGDGEAAVAEALRTRPDVVLMDLQMPGTNGLEATRRLTAELPGTAVVVLTMVENDEAVAAALRAGARGYLVKGASKQDITRALEAAGHGDVILGAGVGAGVLSRLTTRGDALAPFQQLSEREREVLDLVAQGLTNGAIARQLYLSEKTVRNIVSSILSKLPAATRAEAVARARDAGMGGASV